jgi:hypothetical protein
MNPGQCISLDHQCRYIGSIWFQYTSFDDHWPAQCIYHKTNSLAESRLRYSRHNTFGVWQLSKDRKGQSGHHPHIRTQGRRHTGYLHRLGCCWLWSFHKGSKGLFHSNQPWRPLSTSQQACLPWSASWFVLSSSESCISYSANWCYNSFQGALW